MQNFYKISHVKKSLVSQSLEQCIPKVKEYPTKPLKYNFNGSHILINFLPLAIPTLFSARQKAGYAHAKMYNYLHLKQNKGCPIPIWPYINSIFLRVKTSKIKPTHLRTIFFLFNKL